MKISDDAGAVASSAIEKASPSILARNSRWRDGYPAHRYSCVDSYPATRLLQNLRARAGLFPTLPTRHVASRHASTAENDGYRFDRRGSTRANPANLRCSVAPTKYRSILRVDPAMAGLADS